MGNPLGLKSGDVVELTHDNPWCFSHGRRGHLFYVESVSAEGIIEYLRCRELKRTPGVYRLSRASWACGQTDAAAFEPAYFQLRARDVPRPTLPAANDEKYSQ